MRSTGKASRKCLEVLDFSLVDPTSPTKGSKSGESVFPVFDLSMDDDLPTYNDDIGAFGASMSCPELLPVECHLDDAVSDTNSADSEASLYSAATPDDSDFEDEDLEEIQSEIAEPTSPTMKRLTAVRSAPKQFTPTAAPSSRLFSTSILEDSLLGDSTPHRPSTSALPSFEAKPLFTKRPVPVIPTPSRIPGCMDRRTTSSAAPGIRMPGEFRLTYDRPYNFSELSRATSSSGNSADTSIPIHLDGHLDVMPKCSVYLSSPYPRLTKQSNHTVKYYEKRVHEMQRDSQPSLPTPHQVARSKLLDTTPKKAAPTPTAAPKTVESGKRTSTRTIPISPKLATAARTRKCQCCEGGMHSHTHKHSKAQPNTTVGKRATTLRRRPDAAGTPSRFATPSASTSKTMRSVRHAPSTTTKLSSKDVRFAAPTPTPSKSSTTPAKPKLNLTTSLPEFKQPLANIAPTPQKTRQEIDDKLKTPLPQPAPHTPNTSAAAVNGRIAALEAAQTPSKLRSLDEILGPNYRLVHDFNASNPLSDAPLEQSLKD